LFTMSLSFSGERLVPRRIPSQNVVSRLISREMFGPSHRRTSLNTTRGFHTNIFPDFTLVNVEKPPCFLRKFSPDGKKFIAFSADQTSLEIYDYQGPAAAADLLHGVNGEFLNNEDTPNNNKIRNVVFNRFFKLKYTVSVSPCNEQLNRECSLFTDNGHFVIVGSAVFIPEEPHQPLYETYRNNESVSPNPRNPLEDYTLHIIDIQTGRLCDRTTFKTDKIFLSHNQGLYLYKDTLAVLSVQHQTIYIFQIVEGHFIEIRKIGRVCHDDDEILLNRILLSQTQSLLPGSNKTYRPYKEATINLLKHRILVFLYRRAETLAKIDKNPQELRKFYKYFDQIRWLKMWKMQLLDENHLLIKYASEEVVTLRSSEPNSQPSYFVVYNTETTDVTAVYENTSEELLDLFENFCDLFRNACLSSESRFTSSPSNNIFANLIQQRFKQTIVSAKNGGSYEARKRVLAQLPISAQSYSSSPYLDLSLFSYDDKWVSVMERPKACGEHPIRFYGRECGLLKFRIYAGVQGRNPPPQARRLVAFTFHPTDPFAISVQRTNLEYVVNFHVRHDQK
jgi:de-etiolated-1